MNPTISPTCPPLRGGDCIFFWGTDFLSHGIIDVTQGPSHMAMVVPHNLIIDGRVQKELHIIESTISDTDNGVQFAPLSTRIAGYDAGGSIAAACLSDRMRWLLDFDAMWNYATGNLSKRYNVLEIGAYLLNEVLPGSLAINDPDPNAVVCSEFCAELFRAGGWPGLNPFIEPPKYFWQARAWREAALLAGPKPFDWDKFNTV